MKETLTLLRRLMPYLPAGANRYMLVFVVISCLLAILDVAALMLLAVSMSGMLQGESIELPGGITVAENGYVVIILIVSTLILTKSVLALIQQWFATRKFAGYELELGSHLFDAYIRAPWVKRISSSTSELVRMVDVGVSAVVSGYLLPLLSLPGQLSTSVLVLVTLLIVQPGTALITGVYLSIFAFVIYAVLRKKTLEAGGVNVRYSYHVASLMTDMIGAMKEITLRDKSQEIAAEVRRERVHATRARANLQFIGQFPRFILDIALIGGFLIIGGGAFLLSGSLSEAIGAIALFAVAAVRLIPALITFQSVTSTIDGNKHQVRSVVSDLEHANERDLEAAPVLSRSDEFSSVPKKLELRNVSFTYPNRDEPSVVDVSLTIPFGSSVGFVGFSGSGKTTLVDIILGLFSPQSGEVIIGVDPLEDVLYSWRQSVGYVPQEVSLFNGTIAQNVALTWGNDIDYEQVELCLKKAQLWDAVQERSEGMMTKIGERGIVFSGGQRQRIGIARALYTNPLVLIMDESTSSLDTKTEAQVSESIQALKGEVTVISVAHRLSTVRDADMVCYMESGRILATGTFDEVVATVPTFAEQARLAGLMEGDDHA